MGFVFELQITVLVYQMLIKQESSNVFIAQMHHAFAQMVKELGSDFQLLMQLCAPMLAK
jgi:hypothetical protein